MTHVGNIHVTLCWMCRSEGHVRHGAADQRTCQTPRGLQAHHAHLSERRGECQGLQVQRNWEYQPGWDEGWWRCDIHVIQMGFFFFFCSRWSVSVFEPCLHVVLTPAGRLLSVFVKDYPMVLSAEVLSSEVPYLGGDAEMKFYVEGLRFPDRDFNGLVSINLSLLEPINTVRPAARQQPPLRLPRVLSRYILTFDTTAIFKLIWLIGGGPLWTPQQIVCGLAVIEKQENDI